VSPQGDADRAATAPDADQGESNEVAVLLVVGFVCLLVGALCAWLLSGRRAGAKVTLTLLVMAAALGTGETSVTAQVAESVVGGGNFNIAPVLSPGLTRTTPTEQVDRRR
jgi:hypothetical protein